MPHGKFQGVAFEKKKIKFWIKLQVFYKHNNCKENKHEQIINTVVYFAVC